MPDEKWFLARIKTLEQDNERLRAAIKGLLDNNHPGNDVQRLQRQRDAIIEATNAILFPI